MDRTLFLIFYNNNLTSFNNFIGRFYKATRSITQKFNLKYKNNCNKQRKLKTNLIYPTNR